MSINDLLKKLQQLRKAVPGDSEIRFHENDNIIECEDFILKMNTGKIKNQSYCCYRCLHDPRCKSKDGKYRLCSKVAAEVSIDECKDLRK